MTGTVTNITINSKQVQYNIDLGNDARMIIIDKETDNLKYKIDQVLTISITIQP